MEYPDLIIRVGVDSVGSRFEVLKVVLITDSGEVEIGIGTGIPLLMKGEAVFQFKFPAVGVDKESRFIGASKPWVLIMKVVEFQPS